MMRLVRVRLAVLLLLALLMAASPVQAVDRVALGICSTADTLATAGNYAGALDTYNQSLLLDNEYAPAWYGKGTMLNCMGRYAEANDAFDQALLRDMSYVPAWNGKGVALHNLGRSRDALRAYNFAIALDPNNTYARANREQLMAYIALQPTPTPRNSRVVFFAPTVTATPVVTTAPASQKEILYAKDVSSSAAVPAQGSAVVVPASQAGKAASATQGAVSSGDVGNALDSMAAKGIRIGADANSTRNFVGAVDFANNMGNQASDIPVGEASPEAPKDFLSSIMSMLNPLGGLKLS